MLSGVGLAKLEISGSSVGVALAGYRRGERVSTGINDPLSARALVFESAGSRIAICCVDIIHLGEDIVSAARERIAASTGIAPERTFITATHTHSAPFDDDPAAWGPGLDAWIGRAVELALARVQPARVGAGWGMLHGHTMNRRRFEEPVDPAVLVVRIDDEAGRPLGVLYSFGCHPVVFGPDNLLVSGDWPAVSSRLIEEALGDRTVAVFVQGACADVNPLTESTSQRLAAGRTIRATSESWYYGDRDAARDEDRIGNNVGGTFDAAIRLGAAVAEETIGVHQGVEPVDLTGVWTRKLEVPSRGAAVSRDPRSENPAGLGHRPPRVEPDRALETMLVGIDGPDLLLVGQPGEVFARCGAGLRRELRNRGIRHPFVVGYANGWRGYLPPADAYPDGGYETDWARSMELAETVQDGIRTRVLAAVSAGSSSDRPV